MHDVTDRSGCKFKTNDQNDNSNEEEPKKEATGQLQEQAHNKTTKSKRTMARRSRELKTERLTRVRVTMAQGF